ncbi:MAG TPA: hypothetical protein DEA08_37855 [Planctomycetes bacterium]|nr:hypothetical protein [Planctomycetota bacterium]
MTTALAPTELQPFELADLDQLLAPQSGPCVTLLLPTHRAFPERDQDPIRFRNLIEQARQALPPEHSRLVEALSELDDPARWRGCSGGLAVFRSPDTFLIREVPGQLPELCEVAERFALTPLMAELQRDLPYFVLSLSKNAIRLYSGSRRGLELMDAPAIPVDVRDALGEEEHIQEAQHPRRFGLVPIDLVGKEALHALFLAEAEDGGGVRGGEVAEAQARGLQVHLGLPSESRA